MEELLSVGIGLGLAAACGFRVFVPLLGMSVAANSGHLALTERFEWIGSPAALTAFAIATALEVGAYFIPWLDNLLDSVATPAAVVAGIMTTAATVTDMSPFLSWSLAIIGGGGVAATIQTATAVTRGASSMLTAGFGNPLLAAAETGGSVVLAGLAMTVPLVAGAVALLLVSLVLGRWIRRGVARAETPVPEGPGGA